MQPLPVYLSIDVGTGSARAALFDELGRCLARADAPFPTHNPKPDYFEQSTVQILKAVASSTRQVLETLSQNATTSVSTAGTVLTRSLQTLGASERAELGPAVPQPTGHGNEQRPAWQLCGIGVDATCSLALVSAEQAAFFRNCYSDECASPEGLWSCVPGGVALDVEHNDDDGGTLPQAVWDIIVWMDHRAEAEAAEMNADTAECTQDVLRFYGGSLSPESEPPKLLWLLRHRPELFLRCTAVMDLSDFIVFALTGNLEARGLCPLAAKWAYRTDEMRWDTSFYQRWGLGDLFTRGCFGREIRLPGQRVHGIGDSVGLSKIAAFLLFGSPTSDVTSRASNCTLTARGEPVDGGAAAQLVWDYREVVVAAGMVDAHAGAVGAYSMRIPARGERSDWWIQPTGMKEAPPALSAGTRPMSAACTPTGHACTTANTQAMHVLDEHGLNITQCATGSIVDDRSNISNETAPSLMTIDLTGARVTSVGTAAAAAAAAAMAPFDWCQRIALIAGTSTCHMVCSREPVFVRGVWGPHRTAVLPDLWLNEGGQSVTGRLLDYLVESHAHALGFGNTPLAVVHARLCQLGKHQMKRAAGIHVYPDFHGNRSLLADPRMSGAIVGLRLDTFANEEAFAALYLATVQSLGYGTRQIIERLNEAGHDIRVILLCGGMLKNELFVQSLADTCQLPVVFAERPFDVMLLGGAICARCAHLEGDLLQVIEAMNGGPDQLFYRLDPDPKWRMYHEAKYRIFQRMQQEQIAYRAAMMNVWT